MAAVLILSPQPTGIIICLVITFRSNPILEKFPHVYQRSHRLRYIPLAPADKHPDTHVIFYPETTGKPSVTKAGKQSHVRLHEPFFVPSGILQPLIGGTARLSMWDMAVVAGRKTKNNMKAVSEWRGVQGWMERKAGW
ncbi:hypothetical protein K440DRAFT_639288 [Wilcoxina mikolae CBS 423.85]|nr:hypothetical protein K440DRAFT_639288 [Wilcoxina mikolae CBS 423.85]